MEPHQKGSHLKDSTILSINGIPIKQKSDVTYLIKKSRKLKATDVKVIFGTIDKIPLHPSYGVPQMHFDQLNVVAHHLHQMKGY